MPAFNHYQSRRNSHSSTSSNSPEKSPRKRLQKRDKMEHILTPKVENVRLVDWSNPKTGNTGTLHLTTSHLIFVPATTSPSFSPSKNSELWILYNLIHVVEKPTLTTSGSQIKILCHNFQCATFIISKDRDAQDVYHSVVNLQKRPSNHRELYCFTYSPKSNAEVKITQSTGWAFHDLASDFQRMGVPNEKFALCNLNSDFGLCPTYPEILIVPSTASKSDIEGSAKFRSKARLPALSYYHSANGAFIARCAQPMVGIVGARSSEDEHYINLWYKAGPPNAPHLQVIDTRPMINATLNKAGGKGYENDKYYENIKFTFRGIENIHKVRGSLKSLIEVLGNGSYNRPDNAVFLSEIANSNWLKHVKALLDCCAAIITEVLEGTPVMVHCSDGWDRTAQTCALSSLMLDGYYRTILGFQALIEKDFLAFGFKFSDRCNIMEIDSNEVSPIVTHFLDGVWQLMRQFPRHFQFNKQYLADLQEAVYSCQFGTFVGNCRREREEYKLSEKTYSFWGHLATETQKYANKAYDAGTVDEVIRPDVSPAKIGLFSWFYCRNGLNQRWRDQDLSDLVTYKDMGYTQTSAVLEDTGKQLKSTFGQVTSMFGSATSAAFAAGKAATSAASTNFKKQQVGKFNRENPSTFYAGASNRNRSFEDPVAESNADGETIGDVLDAEEAVDALTIDERVIPAAGTKPSCSIGAGDPLGVVDSQNGNSNSKNADKKFTDLKASILEKCQAATSKTGEDQTSQL